MYINLIFIQNSIFVTSVNNLINLLTHRLNNRLVLNRNKPG